ncbi:MAG: hypothetical protein ACK56F_02305, partial [bacterium]
DYDVFAYFSSEFFQNLVSPKYQIELKRRMRAIAALENAELASIVAKNPAIPHVTAKWTRPVRRKSAFTANAICATLTPYVNRSLTGTPSNAIPSAGRRTGRSSWLWLLVEADCS